MLGLRCVRTLQILPSISKAASTNSLLTQRWRTFGTIHCKKCFSVSASNATQSTNNSGRKNEVSFYELDGSVPRTPDGRMVVYQGSFTKKLRRLKRVTLFSSAMALALQPYIFERASTFTSASFYFFQSILGAFTFLSPYLINKLATRYVTEVYYDQNKDVYAAVVYNIFHLKKEIRFGVDDISSPDILGMFTTFMINHKVGGKIKKHPVFIFEDEFLDPYHYGRFKGFDKPIDLEPRQAVKN